MKFRSRSFILLAAVALVFFAGANIYVNAQFGAVDLAGEVLAGERSAAEGITVHERDVLYSRVEFSASYDAGSGESRSDGGLISGYDGSVPVTWGDPALGAEAVRLTSGVLTWEGPEPDFDAFEPWEREIYSDIVSSFPGEEGSFSGRVLLNDYTDTTPVRLSGLNGLFLANYTSREELNAPLPAELLLDVSIEAGPDGGSASFAPADDCEAYARAAFTDDSVYFTVWVTGLLDSAPAEPVPNTLTVFRMKLARIGPEDFPYTYLTYKYDAMLYADFATLETYCSADCEWNGALLTAGCDSRPLLFTSGPGGLRLHVLSRGGAAQELLLAAPSDAYSLYDGTAEVLDGCVVLDAGQVTAAAATDADGRYYAVCAFDERDLPEPGSAGSNAFLHFTREMCAWDGHRLAILNYGYWLPDHGMRYRYYSRLSVYEDGELVFCEWLPALLHQQPFAERALTLSAEPREVTP